ncbi:MAG TPA: TPM domain-containing protein [Oscillospiraceae bacterium]|nr:TPM domain-containing protein [Oscillospiraceae bacterium]
MKKIMVSILIAALMLGLFAVTAFADQWVYDNADLFTDTEEADLEEKSAAFRAETGMDFVILTASDAYSSAMERADDFYDQNGFAADGMLYLIDMYNREAWISTSGEMIYILTDSRISSVFDETNTLLSDGAYYDAAEGVLGICKDYAKSGPPSGGSYAYDSQTGEILGTREEQKQFNWIFVPIALLLGGAGFAAPFFFVSHSYELKGSTYHYNFHSSGDLDVTARTDQYLNTTVVRIPHPKDNDNGFGGGGGGSAVHTSSGGASHGGGGRGF